jgi:hypothetical protein
VFQHLGGFLLSSGEQQDGGTLGAGAGLFFLLCH